ncbi:RICIN domain-containing protein [Streptomyces sp. NBC_01283]|uniref:RICIN domain-containing protein n=1 Tax=Streptomyces sp. NBC_01283 TaxID=2903812 RepID=UPI00352D395D
MRKEAAQLRNRGGRSSADGPAVTQWARHDGTIQQFPFVDSGDGYYRLKARHSGKLLDVSSWSTQAHRNSPCPLGKGSFGLRAPEVVRPTARSEKTWTGHQ